MGIYFRFLGMCPMHSDNNTELSFIVDENMLKEKTNAVVRKKKKVNENSGGHCATGRHV